jgi:hypothetical protein|tara:strand:+ start:2158 stop:2409 length:252 start_codon:yes stop_codon:yes gene_type:complete
MMPDPTKPSITGSLVEGWRVIDTTPQDVMVDLIMVQVISLLIGSFLLLATQGYKMSSTTLSWTVAIVMSFFALTGIVYRRMSS